MQGVVPVGGGGRVRGGAEQGRLRGGEGEGVLAAAPGRLAADGVDQPPGGDRHQPAARVLRQAVGRPLGGGGQQRFLHGVLAGVEQAPAVAAHQRPEGLRREFAQQTLGEARSGRQSIVEARSGLWAAAHTSAASGDGDSCRIGHSSTGSTSAYGMSAAIRWARSRLSQSRT